MLIKRLLIENLRSYENQEIIFPKGSILLSGDVGAGKTTLLLAIEFALFGLQPGQKGSSILRNGADEGKVILEFEVENKNIIIERNLKRSKKSVNQDRVCLTIDGEKFEQSITEIKTKVLKLLNYPLEFTKKTNLLYRFTVYTPQEEMKQIILESSELRLDTLRYVFGIDKYKRIKENAEILTTKLREKIKINESAIKDLEECKENLKQKIENLNSLKEKQKVVIENYENAVKLRESKEKIKKDIEEKINEKKNLENEKSKSLLLISEKSQQIISLNNTIKSLKEEIENTKKITFDEGEFKNIDEKIRFQENKESESQKSYMDILSKINSDESKKIEAENLKLKILGLKKCPTCLQEVSEEYKKNIFSKINNEIRKIEENIRELYTKKDKLVEDLDFIKKTKGDLVKRKSELELLKIKIENLKEKEKRINDIESQRSSIEKDIELLKKHLVIVEKSISDYSKYDSLFLNIEKELRESKLKEEECIIKKIQMEKDIQFLEEQINDKMLEIEKKEDIKRKISNLKEIEYWISENFINFLLFTEKQLMITLKDEFSKLFSKWFSILVSDSLSAKLDEDFSPIIEQQDYELDYDFLSGGERTAVALAYRLALNQVINSFLSNIKTKDLIILDEPTDGFSSQQLDKMRDVLNQLNVKQLVMVSHEPKIENFVDTIIKITKESGITKVESA